jgi:MFS family permease
VVNIISSPISQFETKKPGGAAAFGLVQSVANFFSLTAGLVMGRLSDLHGPKSMLVICQVRIDPQLPRIVLLEGITY